MNTLLNQILRFGIVGVIATLIDFSLLFILTEFVGINYFYSAIISFSISLLLNYIFSIKWVFNINKETSNKLVIKFIILSIMGLGINQVIMYVLVEILLIYYMVSKIFATAVVMVWNFVTRKILIERK